MKRFAISLFSVLGIAPATFGAAGSWNVNAAGGWQDTANWLAGVIPDAVDDTASLSFDINAARSISLNGSRTLGSLTIGDPSSAYFAYTIAAGSPATSSLVFARSGLNPATLTYPVTASTANNTISAPIILQTDLSITASATTTANQSLSGIISQNSTNRSLTLTGGGIVTLGGLNTYQGTTTINAGKINANTFLSFGSGPVVVNSGGQANLAIASTYANNFTLAGNGFAITETNNTQSLGALRYSGSITTGVVTAQSSGARIGALNTTFGIHAGSIVGSGNLEINSTTTNHSGLFILTGDISGHSGTLNLRQGTLKLASTDLGGSLTAGAGTRLHLNTISADGSSPVIGSDTSAARGLTLGDSAGCILYLDPSASSPSAVLGDLVLAGVQTVTPTTAPAANSTLLTYTGSLTGSSANLELPSGIASYRPGTSFQIVPGTPNSIQLNLVAENRSWTKPTSGTWNTADFNWNTQTAETFVNGDRITFGDFDETSETVTVNLASTVAPSSLTFSNSSKNYLITGTGSITGTAQILKTGTGTVTIGNTGASSFAGDIRVENGTLHLAPSASLATSRFSMIGGRFASATTAALTLNANADLQGQVALGDSTTGRTGGITFNGIHRFAPATSISVARPVSVAFAGVNILPSSLELSVPFEGAQNANLVFSGDIRIAADTTINVTSTFNSSNQVTFNGPLTDGPDAYSLTKQGPGALRLASANLYEGGTLISGGTLVASNSRSYGTGAVTVEGSGQAYLLGAGTYTNSFSIQGTGQTLNGLNDTSPSGAIHLNASNQIITGSVVLTGDARIAGYFSSSGNIISGNITESGGSWKLDLGNPGSANGTGTLRLSGSNTYTGGTMISRKTVQAFSNTSLGSGEVEISNGLAGNGATIATRLEIGTSVSLANDFYLNHAGRTNATTATQTWGVITGNPGDSTTASTAIISGDIEIATAPANGGHFASQGHATDSILRVTGEITSGIPVTVAAGVVEFGGGGDYAEIQHFQGTLRPSANQGLAASAKLVQGLNGASIFDLNGFNQTLAALGRAGSGAATIINQGATASTLTLSPADGATHAYSGQFITASSPLNLAVSGSSGSVISFTGNSPAYSGITTIRNGGILSVDAAFGSSSSQITVEAGGTLAGVGTIGGNVTLQNGARLRVDPSLGTLTIAGNLTILGTVTVEFVGTPNASNLIITTNGTVQGASTAFVIANPGNYSAPQFNFSGGQVLLTTGVLNLTWTGNGGSTWNINATANWTNGVSPFKFLNGYSVNFTDSPPSNPNIQVPAAVQPSSITFNNTTLSYEFGDSSDGRIQTNQLVKSGTGNVLLALPLEVSSSITLNGGNLILRSFDYAEVNPALTAPISGTGTLTLAAGFESPLTLSGSSAAFAGNLVVAIEEVRVTASAATGSATITLGSTIASEVDQPRLHLASGVAISNPIIASPQLSLGHLSGDGGLTGSASITKLGEGSLHLSTSNQHQGPTLIEAGTLRATIPAALPATSVITFGSSSTGALATTLELPPAATANQTVLSAPIILNPDAPLSVATIARYNGPTASIGSPITLNQRNLRILDGGLRLAGPITGSGGLIVTGIGQPVILASSANDFTGEITVESGTLQTENDTALPSTNSVDLTTAGTLALGKSQTLAAIKGQAGSIVRPVSEPVELTIDTPSDLTFGGSLANQPAPGFPHELTVNKSGTGTLTLTGNSSATGWLRAQSGRIEITGTLANKIAVTGTGVLGGTGTINHPSIQVGGGLLPIAGRISPGTISAIGALDLQDPIAFQTGGGMDVRIADWNGTSPGASHDHLICPQIIFGASLFTVRLDASALTNFVEEPRSFVIATTTSQLFPPGSNAQQVIVSNFPGAGIWTITAPDGQNLRLNYTPPAAGYASWLQQYPALSGNSALRTADPDGDGRINLMEYVLNSDPTSSSTAGQPLGSHQPPQYRFTYQRRTSSKNDTQQIVQWSTDLTLWNDITIPSTSSGNITIAPAGEGLEDIEVIIPTMDATSFHVRLKVTANP